MTAFLGMPLAPEIALFAMVVLVLFAGLAQRSAGVDNHRGIAWATFSGLTIAFLLTFAAEAGRPQFGGVFLQDSLAIFAKRIFIGAAALSLLGSLTLDHPAFTQRAPEYHIALLMSVIGMSILASARELITLFVGFELMSIPLYVMTGFLKRDAVASEAALKFFLIGTVSAAVIAYGMSFIFGVTGSTLISGIAPALADGHPLLMLGLGLVLAGLGFKIAAFPFHMWAPDAYEAAPTPFVAWLSVAPKAAGFVAIMRLYIEGLGSSALVWMPVVAAMAGMTIVTGNLMAIPQRNIKRLLAYSGIAHIGYMLVGLAALSANGVGMVLFYLVAYLFGNMGAFLVVEAVARSEQSDSIDAYRGLAQRSPLLALAMLIFLLSLGGIPFVAGFWAKLYVFWAAIEQGMYGLVFLGAVLTVVALYYYLLVARRMYIEAPVRSDRVRVPGPLGIAITICVLAVVGIGAYPAPWVDAAMRVASTLFTSSPTAAGLP